MINWVNVVHTTAGVVTILQFASEAFVLHAVKDVWLEDYCKTCPIIPFLGSAVASMLYMQYGNMLQDGTMTLVYTVGLLVNIVLMCPICYHTASEYGKAKYMRIIGVAVALTCGILCYVRYEDPTEVEFRFGIIRTIVQLLVVATPMIFFGDGRPARAEDLWFPSLLLGFVAMLSWALYGLLLGNHTLVAEKLSAMIIYMYIISVHSPYGGEFRWLRE
ncbi:uncharacterized protein LOC128737911 [Sabethes cyaneus]|uniref:uncharacterized protein LOC128737911 n=1 Tax=Sabethes cyaneus TaxID=53552 RepID=UPI00237ECBB3|nr:uncharacterized protein LOC128737911 [Sabethes cyaneus]